MSCLKWYGGKSLIAKRIVDIMPAHTRYLEAFAGGLSVLFAKTCDGVAEWANDLNGELQNFWKVVGDKKLFTDFRIRANLTPLSEPLFDAASETQSDDPIERALAFFIRYRQSRMGLGSCFCTPTSRIRRGMNENVSAWLSAVAGLEEAAERLQRVEIWNKPAVEAIRRLDSPELLTYCDPPYRHETRSGTDKYKQFEMTDEDHNELLECLSKMRGKFILSGYHSPTYDAWAIAYKWNVIEIEVPNSASNAKEKEIKTECLWTNYQVN